jgi:hypothetical protein
MSSSKEVSNAENESTLEQRVTALEQRVREIKRRILPFPENGDWVDQIAGSMVPFPEFAEVVRLGRGLRKSDKDRGK